MRTSGTEPKIKYYSEWQSQGENCQEQLDTMVQRMVDILLCPAEHGLLFGAAHGKSKAAAGGDD